MARRVSWTNNSSDHLGAYVYRGQPLDPQNLPAPLATVGPVAQGATAEWIDNEDLSAGDYDYAVQDFDGAGVSAVSAVVTHAALGSNPFAGLAIGDPVEGGYFAGVMLDESDVEYGLVVSPKAQGDPGGTLTWQNATDFAAGLSIGGHADWGLPTLDEMRILYRAFKPSTQSNNTSYGATDRVDPPLGNYASGDPSQTTLADFKSGGTEAFVASYYWSATESSSSYAWYVGFTNGYENSYYKTSSTYVRAVRRVPL